MTFCKDHNDMLKNVVQTKTNVEWLVKREQEKQYEWEERQKNKRENKSIHDTSLRGWATWIMSLAALMVAIFKKGSGQ